LILDQYADLSTASSAGIPAELDGCALDLPAANYIARAAELVQRRGGVTDDAEAVASGCRVFLRAHERGPAGAWRRRHEVQLAGPDRVVIRVGNMRA